MTVDNILKQLEQLGTPENVAGMARYAIKTEKAFGVSAPEVKKIAREIGKDHDLALKLWQTEVLEARAVACLIADPAKVTDAQMESWVADLDNWATCDTVTGYLFDKTPYAYTKAFEWAGREEEFVRRAAFALMAWLAVHDKKAGDDKFEDFLPIIEKYSYDDRNFVKKAVNWALRQIGKRNLHLNHLAVKTAIGLSEMDSRSARWIGKDALRELTEEKILERLYKKAK
jgi:3-methyladenine DNA glycosylase AlkD